MNRRRITWCYPLMQRPSADPISYVMAMKRDQDLQIEQAIALIKALPAADRAKIRRQLI